MCIRLLKLPTVEGLVLKVQVLGSCNFAHMYLSRYVWDTLPTYGVEWSGDFLFSSKLINMSHVGMLVVGIKANKSTSLSKYRVQKIFIYVICFLMSWQHKVPNGIEKYSPKIKPQMVALRILKLKAMLQKKVKQKVRSKDETRRWEFKMSRYRARLPQTTQLRNSIAFLRNSWLFKSVLFRHKQSRFAAFSFNLGCSW